MMKRPKDTPFAKTGPDSADVHVTGVLRPVRVKGRLQRKK